MHSVLVEQVIVEKVPKSAIPDIDKKKFLVPADLSGKYEIMKLLYNSTQLFNIFFPFFCSSSSSCSVYVHCTQKNKFTK